MNTVVGNRINNSASALTKQLIELSRQGLTPEDICEALKETVALTPEGVILAIRSATTNKSVSLESLISELGPKMVDVLADIAQNENANESARVKAAVALLERKGCLPLMDADEVSERFKKMKQLREENDAKIVPFVAKAA